MTRERRLAAGMDDHIAGPSTPDRLYAAQQRWATSFSREVNSTLHCLITASPPPPLPGHSCRRSGSTPEALQTVMHNWEWYRDLLQRFGPPGESADGSC